MPRRSTVAASLLALSALLALSTNPGCRPSYIPDTQILDTPENREILEVVERYRKAMEQRDVETLESLVSRRYYENGSTTADQSDDWGFPDLDRILGELKDSVKTCVYDIKVTAIHRNGNRADVDYEGTWSFQYTDGEQDGWSRRTDVNRLSLVKEDGRWKFVAGL